MKNKNIHAINHEIKADNVRLQDVGIVTLKEALELALEADMDLVLIAPTAKPPVCKIMNYEKFLYEENKKSKVKTLDMKEIKIGPNITDNDLSYRITQMVGFLDKGHKVRIRMDFRGREMAHVDKGEMVMLNLLTEVGDHVVEHLPKLENRRMITTIRPAKAKN